MVERGPVLRDAGHPRRADRAREHLEAHAGGDTVTHVHLRAEQVVRWATRGGAKALGLDDRVGSLEAGKKADVVLIRNDHSPVMFPLINPYGHIAFQAQRADVHTVVVDGRVVKHDHRLVGIDLARARRTAEATVEHLRGRLGPGAWEHGMNPDFPETKILDNPYTYTGYRSATTHGGRPRAPPGAYAVSRRRAAAPRRGGARNIPPADAVGSPCWHARVKRIGRWRKEHPMARSTVRPVVRLKSAAGTGVTYVTRKNRLNDPDRLVLRKYDPVAGEHVLFREER